MTRSLGEVSAAIKPSPTICDDRVKSSSICCSKRSVPTLTQVMSHLLSAHVRHDATEPSRQFCFSSPLEFGKVALYLDERLLDQIRVVILGLQALAGPQAGQHPQVGSVMLQESGNGLRISASRLIQERRGIDLVRSLVHSAAPLFA